MTLPESIGRGSGSGVLQDDVKAPDLPDFYSMRQMHDWVAKFTGQPDILQAIIERNCMYYAHGIFDGVRNDMLREQLWDSGVLVVQVAFDMSHHEAMLIRKNGGEKGHTMLISHKNEWSKWPLYFAHELGHAWAPGTCGFETDPDRAMQKELACEAFAHLWLAQPGNLTRARRLLRPLFDRRYRSIRVWEEHVLSH